MIPPIPTPVADALKDLQPLPVGANIRGEFMNQMREFKGGKRAALPSIQRQHMLSNLKSAHAAIPTNPTFVNCDFIGNCH